jgi:hypothetical protein
MELNAVVAAAEDCAMELFPWGRRGSEYHMRIMGTR